MSLPTPCKAGPGYVHFRDADKCVICHPHLKEHGGYERRGGRDRRAHVPEERPHWHPVSEQPKSEDELFVVRDADGQCAFAVRYEGKWEHTADADCGPIAEWFALPPASSSPLAATKEKS